MTLVAHTNLPTYDRLREEGEVIIKPDAAIHQDIRELHIGLLNMMPDAALSATERQFFRLVGGSNQIAQVYMHPFTLPELSRGEQASDYIAKYYESFDQLKQDGLDALIITGANVTQPDLSQEAFWEPLNEVFDWAYNNVTSVICSCLATHAVMQSRFAKKRMRLQVKRWGVFPHRVIDQHHPLVRNANTLFDVPHSRFNEISREQFEQAGMKVLAESDSAGVHLAVSEDLFRIVFFQGHPEYDTISLLKEFKREAGRFATGEREDYPPFPENYFGLQTRGILSEYAYQIRLAQKRGTALPEFPEALVEPGLHNTWRDTGAAVLNNWLGLVYRITHFDRKRPFLDGIDPQNPLGLR